MPTSKATAQWSGGLKGGYGKYAAGSGSFEGEYTFASRFTDAGGTNPEELIAAAHAACLSMALAGALEREGKTPERITTTAHCSIEMVDGKPRVTKVKLEVRGEVPGLSEAAFKEAADGAKDGCPVSNALKNNVQFQLDARLGGNG